MHLAVRDRKRSSLSLLEVRRATRFLAHELMGKRLCENLAVTIRFCPPMGEVIGSSEWVDDNDSPREFEVKVYGDQPWFGTIRILAHEMVHVKQYARGELKELLRNGRIRWKKRIIANHRMWDGLDDLDPDYRKLPWEVEAYRLDRPLARRCALHLRQELLTSS